MHAQVPGPKLYIVHNGQGSPCLDFRRVPDLLAEACSGTDLIIIEGMGRAIHTNLNASFLCDSLKLAMIKTERLSTKLFGPHGSLYDCVCKSSGAVCGSYNALAHGRKKLAWSAPFHASCKADFLMPATPSTLSATNLYLS
eukprot:1160242-Pelagomonas_calceolata.AAC.2